MSETTTLQINRAQFNNKQKELLRDVVSDLEAQIAAEVATLNATISGLPTAPTETLIVQSATTGPVISNTTPAFVSGTEFTWDLEADTEYLLEGVVTFEAKADCGVRINFDSSTATGTINNALVCFGQDPVSNTTDTYNAISTIGDSTVLISLVEENPILHVGCKINCTGSGTLQLNWSNAAATGNDTALQAGSFLKLRTLP